jgi:hypothetical protein
MLLKIILSIAVAAALIIFIWYLRGILLTPVPLGKNMSISAVVRVCGSCRELEATADALLWLVRNGTLPVDIILVDAGMDEESRKVAEFLARDNRCIKLRNAGVEEEWTKSEQAQTDPKTKA